MTLPTNSVSIAGITESSPAVVGTKTSVVRLSDEIKQYQAGMAPPGSVAYDSGWVDITPAAGFTGISPQVRRIGSVITFRGTISGTFAANSTTNLGTAPAGYRPPANDGRQQSSGSTTGGQAVYYMNAAADGSLLVRIANAGVHNVALGGFGPFPVD